MTAVAATQNEPPGRPGKTHRLRTLGALIEMGWTAMERKRPIPTRWERHEDEYWANDWGPPTNYIRCGCCRKYMERRNADRGWRVIHTEEEGWAGVICPSAHCWELAVMEWERHSRWLGVPVAELKQRPVRVENVIFVGGGLSISKAWAGAKRYWPERL